MTTFEERCERAAAELDDLADTRPSLDAARITGKAQGVRLALSYLQDYAPSFATPGDVIDEGFAYLKTQLVLARGLDEIAVRRAEADEEARLRGAIAAWTTAIGLLDSVWARVNPEADPS